MKSIRRLSYVAIVLAFAQIVFGAIVRITGSGMGCGDHWPKCLGAWFPPLDRIDLVIEITHRYMAMALSIAVLALLILAFSRRRDRGLSGPNAVLAPAVLAGILVVTAALLGAVTVKLGLNPYVIAAHLTIAMSLLAVLAVIAVRSGAFGGLQELSGSTPGTARGARIATAMTLVILLLGALTANLPGAAVSCGGFPWCRSINGEGLGLTVQVFHRLLAFLLFGHLWGMTRGTARRREPAPIILATRVAFGLVILQVVVAGAMVEMSFPPVFRSLHQAIGTLVWLAIVILAVLSTRGQRSGNQAAAHSMAA